MTGRMDELLARTRKRNRKREDAAAKSAEPGPPQPAEQLP
jgi:hypothetical protein